MHSEGRKFHCLLLDFYGSFKWSNFQSPSYRIPAFENAICNSQSSRRSLSQRRFISFATQCDWYTFARQSRFQSFNFSTSH